MQRVEEEKELPLKGEHADDADDGGDASSLDLASTTR
jgi:hypothetical protein